MFEHIVGDYCLKFIHYKFKYNLKKQHLPYLWTGSSGKEYWNYKMIFFFNCGVKSNGAQTKKWQKKKIIMGAEGKEEKKREIRD